MDNSLPVRLVQRIRDLGAVTQHLIERQRPVHEAVRERLALEIFHDEVLDAILIPHVVECTDMGMRELRDGLGLPLEALPNLRASGELVLQHLDRDGPLKPCIARPIDLSHSARAEGREDLVGT